MERAAWTDERLDDLAQRIDAGFSRVDADIRELRTTMLQIGGGMAAAMLAGFLGVIATVLATG